MSPARLGLDIDDTITRAPATFAALARAVYAAGGDVHVVSSRSDAARAETLHELRRYGLRFSALHLLPALEIAQATCPHTALSWYERYLWQKVDIALALALTHFVDDDARVRALFARFAPRIRVAHPNDAPGWLAAGAA